MSKYADRLVQYYEDHADFLEPAFRKTEMINNFIKHSFGRFGGVDHLHLGPAS